MGCLSSRTELTAEEATTYNMDILLGYYKINVSKVYKVHLKYSTNNKISEDQFHHISNKLELFELNNNFIQPILNYYAYFKCDVVNYDLNKLLIFAIVQSEGSNEEKSIFLFRVLSQGKEELKKDDVSGLFELIFELLLNMLTKLKVNDFVNELTYNDLMRYYSKLSHGREDSKSTLIDYFFEDRETINEKEFIECAAKHLPENFFTGHGIRSFLKKSVDSKKKISN
jgi:hypothetical protein